jgi:hypothetical protein
MLRLIKKGTLLVLIDDEDDEVDEAEKTKILERMTEKAGIDRAIREKRDLDPTMN